MAEQGGAKSGLHDLIQVINLSAVASPIDETVYDALGDAFFRMGDFHKAKDNHELSLNMAKEVGDRAREGWAYGKLGNDYYFLGDFRKALEYNKRFLEIAEEIGDMEKVGKAYGNLGLAYQGLGDFKKAMDFQERRLLNAKEAGNIEGEGRAYVNLGIVHHSLGNFKEAIDYNQRGINIAKKTGNRAAEGSGYGNVGNAYFRLGDFQKAIYYHELHLQLAKQVKDIPGEGRAYSNLGLVYDGLGDYKTAMYYYERDLEIAQQVGNRAKEGRAYANLGNISQALGDFQKAKDYHESHLKIATEVGDRDAEGLAYGNLGNAFFGLGDSQKATECHECHLEIAKEIGNKFREGGAYGNLANIYHSLRDFRKAADYYERYLNIAKQVEDKVGMANSFSGLGKSFESLGSAREAIDFYQSSVATYNDIRDHLQSNDEWKISLRDSYQHVYARLWRLLLKQGKTVEALLSVEQGRAQALKDLLELTYGFQRAHEGSGPERVTESDIMSCLPPNTIFIAFEVQEVIFWICQKGRDVELRRKQITVNSKRDNATSFFQSLIQIACQEIGTRSDVKCEDRSMDSAKDDKLPDERSGQKRFHSSHSGTNALRTLYDAILVPIADLLHGDELVFVPEGPLWLAPFAAFMDLNLTPICESFRIQLIPSLSTLKLIADCPGGYHSKTGALLVGDPWVQEVTHLQQLPCAREEVQMIGRILHTAPLIGRQATKEEVLKRLSSVALVHIAAHGRMETGEIALTPNPTQPSQASSEEDFILTMRDVLSVQMRASLVVLSCCHSARGEIKAEGVVGIARAFLGAGARSVLVSLWAIDDEATLEFMKSFYLHLVKRKSASEALTHAMKCMRESDKFSAVKCWAPFVLIGDDVTLEFGRNKVDFKECVGPCLLN